MFFLPKKKANHVDKDIHKLAEQTAWVSLKTKSSTDRVQKTLRVKVGVCLWPQDEKKDILYAYPLIWK